MSSPVLPRDPHAAELLRGVRDLLPVSALSVTAHAPVTTSSNEASQLLAEIEAIRVMEGGAGHYMGLMARFEMYGGLAYRPGLSQRGRAAIGNRRARAGPQHEPGARAVRGSRPSWTPRSPTRTDRPGRGATTSATGAGWFPRPFQRPHVLLLQSALDQRLPLRPSARVPDPSPRVPPPNPPRPPRPGPCCCGVAWTPTACRSWSPRSSSTHHPRCPHPAATTASAPGPTPARSCSPSPSTCPKSPTATAPPASPSRSPCSPTGRAVWPASPCRDRAVRPRSTITPTDR